MVCDTDFIVITGNILRPKIVIPEFCPIHSANAITFDGQTKIDCYTGNIVIPKIVKPGFHCINNEVYISSISFKKKLSNNIVVTQTDKARF